MRKCESNLGCKELHLFVLEPFNSNQVSKQLAALNKMHKEVNSDIVLKNILHAHQEGVVDCVQNVLLQIDVFDLVVLQDNIFADTLHREQFFRALMLNQVNFPKRAFSDQLDYFKVLQIRILFVPTEHFLSTA